MKNKLIFAWELTFKNAINAVLTNAALAAVFPNIFHIHDKAGWINIGWAALIAIGVREGQTWGPILLKYSTSPTVLRQDSTPAPASVNKD